jgi:UDP-N-acetylmuramoylalanine--D-glutamate ligase
MDYSQMKVLVMGLGLHGGGFESALFFLRHGASVTITDLREEKILLPIIEKLAIEKEKYTGCRPIHYVLGKHEIEDFKNADLVIKNPGVTPDSPFLKAAKRIETDISVFLTVNKARLFAITGSKGKSTVTSAIHWILTKFHEGKHGKAWLGGNITISPLSFLEEINENDDVVLELSSFQLGDLKNNINADGSPLLKPKAAVITAILPDHLNRYATMEDYVADKRNIYKGQDSGCVTVAGNDKWGKSFLAESKGRSLIHSSTALDKGISGGWISPDGIGLGQLYGEGWPAGASGEITELVPSKLLVPGIHNKQNLLTAALTAWSMGVDAQTIREALALFPGIEHRLELFHENSGIRFYNDSASTIPEATAAAINALSGGENRDSSIVLVIGGTDKNLDFSPLVKEAPKAGAIVLLAGTGSEKIEKAFDASGIAYKGPFDNIEDALNAALEAARLLKVHNNCNIVFSPGCTSFGMFNNEFDRGLKWKELVERLA